MWKKFVTDYLSFTRKDRIGVMVLLFLIVIVVLLPYCWPSAKIKTSSAEDIQKIKMAAAQLKKIDDSDSNNNDAAPGHYAERRNYNKEKAASFYFDPNTLDAAGWKRLGIRDKTISTIQNYLSKGGKFKKPEDIGKIYGLFKDDYERLLPYVQIKDEAATNIKDNEAKKEYAIADKRNYADKKFTAPKTIDINNADTTAFIALPGIGSKLAARIVNFRDKLGGFYDVQQVAETYGLPDSTFIRIRSLLQCNHPVVKQININTEDANTLKQHPYIRWNLANAIVQYRNQHGNFKSVDDLKFIAIVTPEVFDKIRHYLVIE